MFGYKLNGFKKNTQLLELSLITSGPDDVEEECPQSAILLFNVVIVETGDM